MKQRGIFKTKGAGIARHFAKGLYPTENTGNRGAGKEGEKAWYSWI
jgi:hypothetical protein